MTNTSDTMHPSRRWVAEFRGVVTAAVTPFDQEGRIDEGAIDAFVELQAGSGVGALMVGGTTGEFIAMDDHERRRALECFVTRVDGRLPVVANVGHAHPRGARALTEHAAALGVDAVAAITPYFLPHTVAASIDYFRELARAAPDTAFLVYHFPRNATNPFPADAFGQLVDEPNVAGAKCSVGSMAELVPYLGYEPAHTIFCGNDRALPEFAAAGGRACVSGNAAAYPELVARIFAAILDGTATDEDAALLDDIAIAGRDGAPDRLKALLRGRGVDAGWARVRTYRPGEVAADGNDEARARVETALSRLTGSPA